jgi:hypothetical protein
MALRISPDSDKELLQKSLGIFKNFYFLFLYIIHIIADIETFSVEGLRCLLLAYNVIDETKFSVWSNQYNKALADIKMIEDKKNNRLNDIDILEEYIEGDLIPLGATGIEDKLQDGVPDCIESLIEAGIKIWILTGLLLLLLLLLLLFKFFNI